MAKLTDLLRKETDRNQYLLQSSCHPAHVTRDIVFSFVKLHSHLRILTQLQLVGVGVDFVFPLEEEEEGRRRKEGITPT